MPVKLTRISGDINQSTGFLIVTDNDGNMRYGSPCIERGWRDNQQFISCVPRGTYPLVFEYSPAFRRYLWELKDVPGRSECKIHSANFWNQLNGCISLGLALRKINNDNYPDLHQSRVAMSYFSSVMQLVTAGSKETTITIVQGA